MARTNGWGFYYRRHLRPGVEQPATLEVILANSAKVAIGEAVKWSGGYLAACGADAAVLGILVGIVTNKGENVFKTKEAHGGTLSGDDTFTAGASNSTSQMVKGVVIVDSDALFEGKADSSLTQAEVGGWFVGEANTNTGMDGVTGTGTTYTAGSYDFQLVELITTGFDGSAVTDRGLFRIGRTMLKDDATV